MYVSMMHYDYICICMRMWPDLGLPSSELSQSLFPDLM